MGRAQELTDSLAALRGAPEPCPELDGFTLNNSYNILGQFKSAIHCDGLEGYLTPGATNEEMINDVLARLERADRWGEFGILKAALHIMGAATFDAHGDIDESTASILDDLDDALESLLATAWWAAQDVES